MTRREEIARGENVALEFKGEAEGFAQVPQDGLGVCQRTWLAHGAISAEAKPRLRSKWLQR